MGVCLVVGGPWGSGPKGPAHRASAGGEKYAGTADSKKYVESSWRLSGKKCVGLVSLMVSGDKRLPMACPMSCGMHFALWLVR